MFVRYLGGGIGHGGNTVDIETPTVPSDEPDDSSNSRPEEIPDNQYNEGYRKEGDVDATSESEGEGTPDDERTEYSEEDIEDQYSDDEEPSVEL